MPYIKQELRDELLGDTTTRVPETPGELNYLISVLCDDYICNHQLCYTTLNEVIGVLECAKQELYRRILSVYEDSQKERNGDVYQVLI